VRRGHLGIPGGRCLHLDARHSHRDPRLKILGLRNLLRHHSERHVPLLDARRSTVARSHPLCRLGARLSGPCAQVKGARGVPVQSAEAPEEAEWVVRRCSKADEAGPLVARRTLALREAPASREGEV